MSWTITTRFDSSIRYKTRHWRSLVRIFQVLNWAFALSPGARSFACALLACFWESGLFFLLYGIFAYVLPW